VRRAAFAGDGCVEERSSSQANEKRYQYADILKFAHQFIFRKKLGTMLKAKRSHGTQGIKKGRPRLRSTALSRQILSTAG
jgi:hypothetical protein